MRLHRFILDLDLSADQLVIFDREITNQIRNVFRMETGDPFIVCDGKGMEATVQVVSDEGTIRVNVIDRRVVDMESAAKVTLYCAVLKREHFELVVQKVTECGVFAVVPIISARTVKLGVRLDRLQKIAREASEQSGRGVVPEICKPVSLAQAVVQASDNETNVVFELGAPLFPAFAPAAASIGMFVGPEGGWGDGEVEQLRAEGYHMAGLGPRVLRAETAAIVGVFLATGRFNE
ncbi:hypothetical protein A2348_01325 [Candidatus Uhrbacteria bacterium RIFOXYB12_FULL_58_10]|uniref:Ribosomal RNA small subunit methyltransferase E n=1 Tax=Candidatus Uhrbacteria bacterium RIFOXYB2_FULL_57_15 TaxID=1802422 RepID=A0A1F7W9L7_9BACT|nr:MAG: hypothetical protein A2348_01325 [Candidatus Uhrbacteria bacterium RIFOXYB12_FULL_58_10]OGL99058.1 MAG: hypothetical protein A2304_02840 [Candidatus Uhrbacteria bacterium RIFOXYB2_FULL_57_15]OGM00278.1 MAG: hypothetical protein A2501_01965 [Candidatus Uhrbacteria bacterium RIFOXYC12_FULL_57_11]